MSMGPLVTVVAGILDLAPPLPFDLGVVVGAAVVLVVLWLLAQQRWRKGGRRVRRAGYVLKETLSAFQAVAVTIAALLAVDFFLLGPALTESLALAQRIERKTVENLYFGPIPTVVTQTLDQLEGQVFPLTTGATITTAGGVSLKLGQQSAPASQSAATSIVDTQYSNSKLCAGSGAAMVDVLFSGACTIPQFQIPFYDRVLLGLNEQAAAGAGLQPLDGDQLREAAGNLARAVRLRSTVTLLNTGHSTAQNVSVAAADQYSVTTKPAQTSIPSGDHLDWVFDGPAVGTTGQSASVDNPTFPFKSDPTGPVDPAIVNLAVGMGAFAIVATFFIAMAGADRGTEVSQPGVTQSEAPTEKLVGPQGKPPEPSGGEPQPSPP